jgi:putative transposase
MPNHIHGLVVIDKIENGRNNPDELCDPIVETRQCLVSTTTTTTVTPIKNDNTDNDNINDILNPDSPTNPTEKSIGSKRFRNPGKNNLSSVIGSFKSVCTKNIHRQIPEIDFA